METLRFCIFVVSTLPQIFQQFPLSHNYSVPPLIEDDSSQFSSSTVDHPQKILTEQPPERWWAKP